MTNVKSVPLALDSYLNKNSRKVFESLGIFNEKELEARVEVEYEKYVKKIQIEARVLGDLAINHIVPTAINYQTMLIENVKGLKIIFSDEEFNELAGARKDLIKEISNHISNIKSKTKDMIEARKSGQCDRKLQGKSVGIRAKC